MLTAVTVALFCTHSSSYVDCHHYSTTVHTQPVTLAAVTIPLHRRNPTAVRQRCAQRCDSENEHGAVTVMVQIVMLQR